MRFSFDDGGYVELQRSRKPYHIYVIVAVRKPDNPLELIINSAEIALAEFNKMIHSVSGPLMLNMETSDLREEGNHEKVD